MVFRQAHRPGGNIQALWVPRGVPLWVSDVLPGSTRDLTAARELVLPQARPYLTDLPLLADSGYEGAGAVVRSPAALWIRPSTAAWNSWFHRRATSGRSIATVMPTNASTLLTWVPPPGSGLKLHS